jgi:hypothetical protein
MIMKAFALTAALAFAALMGAASTASADHWKHGGDSRKLKRQLRHLRN